MAFTSKVAQLSLGLILGLGLCASSLAKDDAARLAALKARISAMAAETAYVEAITKAWRTKPGEPMEHPFYYDTCWDLLRLVDYLATRDDVDPKRLGEIGFSMGGIETWMAGAVDDRIRVAVPTISIQTGYSVDGLPLAIQLVAGPNREDLLFSVAAWCEKRLAPNPLQPPYPG